VPTLRQGGLRDWGRALTPNSGWLIDETRPLTDSQADRLDRELADSGPGPRSGGLDQPTLAVSIHDVIVHDNRKWFGEAEVRLDALVVTGYGEEHDPSSFYMAKTTPFARIRNSDSLQIGPGGLLAFHGRVSHFVDVFLMVSRDRRDSADLATLLGSSLQSDEVRGALSGLVGLAVAAPHVAAVVAAIGAAGVLGDLAYRLLRTATGSTIGLYRNSHLQHRDGFGIGPHPGPQQETFRANDLSFRYQISLEA
jgi:hypothetical protein